MIYFLEHDSDGNILHICGDSGVTIVPLVNRVEYKNLDAKGNQLSPANLPLLDPVGIDAATYALLMKEGMSNYTYDQATKTVVKKAAAPSA
jgi:hypothetical protein